MYKVGQTIKYKIASGRFMGQVHEGIIIEPNFLGNNIHCAIRNKLGEPFVVSREHIINVSNVINIINSIYKNG